MRSGRIVTLLAGIGAGLGAVVAVAVHFLTAQDPAAIYHGRYVPMDGLSRPKAYESTLSISYDTVHPGWLPMLPLYIGGGLLVGVAAGLVLARWRSRGVSGSSPTG